MMKKQENTLSGRKVLSLLASIVAMLHVASCTAPDSTLCTDTAQCPSGHTCSSDGICELVCEGDDDCPGATYCEAGVCIRGINGPPNIITVEGNSEIECTFGDVHEDLGIALGHRSNCMDDGIVVSGANVSTATFHLERGNDDPIVLIRPDGGDFQSNRIELVPEDPRMVNTGPYALVAVNQAGEDIAGVHFIRGRDGENGKNAECEPGSCKVDECVIQDGDGNKGLPGGGAPAKLFYYDNSEQEVEEPLYADRLVMHLSMPVNEKEKTKVLKLQADTIHRLCADKDGCRISIGRQGWWVHNPKRGADGRLELNTDGYIQWVPKEQSRSIRMAMECRFSLQENATERHWAVDEACYRRYLLISKYKDGTNLDGTTRYKEESQAFAPYASDIADHNNNNSTKGNLILDHANACVFATAQPNVDAGVLFEPAEGEVSQGEIWKSNNDDDFYFIAVGLDWGGETKPMRQSWLPPKDMSESIERTCVLVIED